MNRMKSLTLAAATAIAVCLIAVGLCGCRTTVAVSDTARSGSQQLLLNSSADAVICSFDFSPLAHRTCYLNTDGLGPESHGYLPYRIRERMSQQGVLLTDSKENAEVIVEAGLAAYGTDSQKNEVGVTNADSLPDLYLCIEGTQFGVAKLSLFAWESKTGEALWHSGMMRADAYQKYRKVLGTGPYYSGMIQHPANRVEPAASRRR
ncbi:MAG: DUF6655 family protein [Blastopirellula sp. JB062]